MNSSNQDKNSNHKYKIIMGLILIAILVILYFIEKVLYNLVHIICYFNILTLLVCIILHILFVRYIVLVFLFPGSNFFVQKLIRNENGKVQANHVLKIIKNFKNNIEHLKIDSATVLNGHNLRIMRISLKQLNETLLSLLKIYSVMEERFKLSQYQKKLEMALSMLRENLEESGIQLILDDVWNESENSQSYKKIRDVNLNRHINKICTNCELVEDYINDFMGKRDWKTNFRNFWSNDSFGSINQYRIEMALRFNIVEYNVKTKDDKIIDVVLIKSDDTDENEINNHNHSHKLLYTENDERNENKNRNRNVVVMCGPNGAPFEQLCKNFPIDTLYLENKIDVIVWNYRGYGMTKGTPNYKNIQDDAETVVDFARKQKMWNKIGVHGISIGGLPCCHLAENNLVDLIIADRTFACIEDIIITYPFGNILTYLYKLLFLHPSHNVDKILSSKSYKIFISDPLDTIVKDEASLKTGIAKRIVNHYKFKNEKNNKRITNILEIALPEHERIIFIDSILSIFRIINQNEENKKNIQTQYERKNSQIKSLLNNNINLKYTVVKNENSELNDFDSDSALETEDQNSLDKIQDKITRDILNAFSRFEAAGDSFSTIKQFGIKNKKSGIIFINNFFTNMFVWGCITTEHLNLNSDKIMSHKEIPKRFKKLVEDLNKLINDMKKVKRNHEIEIIGHIINLNRILIALEEKFSILLFKQKNEINLTNSSNKINSEMNVNGLELLEDIENISKNSGNLIPVSCGHNGCFNDTELNLIKYELIKAKFT